MSPFGVFFFAASAKKRLQVPGFQVDPIFQTSKVPRYYYLEDHPSGCKWLITMVIVSPLRIRVVGPLPNGL